LYLIQGNKIIIAACKQHIGKIYGKFLSYGQSHNLALYIIERPSTWDTSRICLSWPRSRGRLSLLLVPFPEVYSCLLWPTPCLAVCSNGSYFALNPFLAYWRLNTSVQVNNTSAIHHIHTGTHIYMTSILLFILFFTLLPLLLAGRLPLTLPVRHSYLTTEYQQTSLQFRKKPTIAMNG
jgi:hypothetical protein